MRYPRRWSSLVLPVLLLLLLLLILLLILLLLLLLLLLLSSPPIMSAAVILFRFLSCGASVRRKLCRPSSDVQNYGQSA